MATATIASYIKSRSGARAEIHVSLVFEQQNITSSSCSDCHCQVWCEHIIAAILYRIKCANDVRVTTHCINPRFTYLLTYTSCRFEYCENHFTAD